MKFACCLALVASLLGCKQDTYEQSIPNISFSGTLNMSNPEYLTSPFLVRTDMQGYALGYAGVVVYKLTSETYYVYDRMCPYEKSASALVTIAKGESSIVTCPKCGSKYSLSGGFGDVINGPSHYPLKGYQNKYDMESDYLFIWN